MCYQQVCLYECINYKMQAWKEEKKMNAWFLSTANYSCWTRCIFVCVLSDSSNSPEVLSSRVEVGWDQLFLPGWSFHSALQGSAGGRVLLKQMTDNEGQADKHDSLLARQTWQPMNWSSVLAWQAWQPFSQTNMTANELIFSFSLTSMTAF